MKCVSIVENRSFVVYSRKNLAWNIKRIPDKALESELPLKSDIFDSLLHNTDQIHQSSNT